MYYNYCDRYTDEELAQSGIIGMHWGIRRYQNPDGTLTPEGRARYSKSGGMSEKFAKLKADHAVRARIKKAQRTKEKKKKEAEKAEKEAENLAAKKKEWSKSSKEFYNHFDYYTPDEQREILGELERRQKAREAIRKEHGEVIEYFKMFGSVADVTTKVLKLGEETSKVMTANANAAQQKLEDDKKGKNGKDGKPNDGVTHSDGDAEVVGGPGSYKDYADRLKNLFSSSKPKGSPKPASDEDVVDAEFTEKSTKPKGESGSTSKPSDLSSSSVAFNTRVTDIDDSDVSDVMPYLLDYHPDRYMDDAFIKRDDSF